MITIQNINGTQVTFYSEELNTSVVKQLSDLTVDDLCLDITIEPYTQHFFIYGPDLSIQQLWQSYMNNVMSLSEVQSEATDRSIDTTGKTQDQLARSIIQSESASNSFDYLLEMGGLSVPTMESLSVEKPKKSAAKTTTRKKKK